jgi:hypothetical protein
LEARLESANRAILELSMVLDFLASLFQEPALHNPGLFSIFVWLSRPYLNVTRAHAVMRRFYGFFFLILVLLNTIGYYEVLLLIDQQQRERAVTWIDENENEINGNMVLRIPMALPYAERDLKYERAHGEVVCEGEVYHVVKQMTYRDTLYVVCLKDRKGTKVRNVIADYSKTFADQKQESGNAHKEIASFAKFYTIHTTPGTLREAGWFRVINYSSIAELYSFSAAVKIFQPPW